MLHRLIYASRRARGSQQGLAAMLQSILCASVRNNLARQLTGLLIAHDGWFLQALEGPPETVRAAFAAIGMDERHTAPVLLDLSPVEGRAFGRWIMAGRVLSGLDAGLVTRFGIGGSESLGAAGARALPFMLAVARSNAASLDAQHDHLTIPLGRAA